MGRIGTIKRTIILEPIPDDIPVPEIVPQPRPAPQPVKTPA